MKKDINSISLKTWAIFYSDHIDAFLIDTFQDGLELDTSSVKLFKQTLQPNGTLVKGEEVNLHQNKKITGTIELLKTDENNNHNGCCYFYEI